MTAPDRDVSYAAAISEHPVTASAVGETAGQILEQTGDGLDLAVLFVTPHHAGALEDAAGAVRAVLRPGTLIGCAAVAVAGNGREVEDGPAVALWAARLAAPVAPLVLHGEETPDGPLVVGWPDASPFEPEAVILVADPFTFPADTFLGRLAADRPGLPVIGGMASGARGPGGSRLVLDDHVMPVGAVGALLGPGSGLTTVVSQGCRPIGDPFVVTKAERNVIYELGGQPPLQRLEHLARRLPEDEVQLVNQGLHLGLVIDEQVSEYHRGDFLIRNVLGADRANGAIAVDALVEVGTTVQFQVRDGASADEDLRLLLTGREADAALLFTCSGRGRNLFDEPDHDTGVLAQSLDGPQVAGFFAAGELGPVGGRNFLHGFTASIALFRRETPV